MVSREYDYSHLVLDPAALGGAASSGWADPSAVEIPPQLLAALGDYLSSSSSSSAAADAESEEADDEFMMYEFKVRRCARARSHDWTACPYAHPGEAARRRDPRRARRTRASRARTSGAGRAPPARAGTRARSRTARSSCGSTRRGTAPAPAARASPAAAASASSRTPPPSSARRPLRRSTRRCRCRPSRLWPRSCGSRRPCRLCRWRISCSQCGSSA
ncbi:hypothetical protein PR202_ga05723 [Eleusine coracana subsp. coracana]|uniref:AtC3H23-like CCCH zinc finger domain-containing protein n=1 Tax=Eleusine coracana subsp. coracana TaxID=191504 RepID=A0AAV5BU69_ELECO|nr:hypothetical protein PR202_ga05723 [Eleusine coracana subsp. coracana]